MRYTSKYAVEFDLEQHYLLRKQYQEKCSILSEYEGFRIKENNRRKTRTFYSLKRPGESRYQYAGDSLNTEIQYVRELSYYKEMLIVIESNIRAMEDFLSIYRLTKAESINELLPKVYRLPKEASLLKAEPEVYKWLQEQRSLKDKYPVINPQGLKCTAFDGTLMRSRAECIHYEAFFIYNIPCIFELPYEVGRDILSPDFTALDVFLMMPKIFEHLGNWFHKDLVKRRQYRNESIERWDSFAHIGFFPEVNLFLTFAEGEDLFDAQAIHRKIAMLASPPPSEETLEMLRRL
ncbi:MAG: hypothetical protein IJJ06_05420 [Mogibacterium sp.]|nr:hypothetical protein [Mogibacterium sp.]